MKASKPSWLTEPCPPWCVVDHGLQVIEADRRHEAEAVAVPVIVRQPPRCTTIGQRPSSATVDEVDLAIFRDVDGDETWVVIADGTQSIEFTLESASRVSLALDELLRQAS